MTKMKTKIVTLIVSCLFLSQYLMAQQVRSIPPKPTDETYEYIPFPTDNAVWTNRSYHNFYGPGLQVDRNFFSTVFMKGDTIWDGKTYSKLYVCKGETPDYSPGAFWGGIREENKRIYVRQSHTYTGEPYAVPMVYPYPLDRYFGPAPSVEYLCYDFNIPSDPATFYAEYLKRYHMEGFAEYERTDYEWIGERWRRVVYFKSKYAYDNPLFTFRWIDGIGNDRGFCYNGTYITTGNHNFRETNLLCFFQDGVQQYHADNIIIPFEGSDDCFRIDDLLLGLSPTVADPAVRLRYEHGSLVWDAAVSITHVLLYDLQARLVFSSPTVGVHSVSLPATIPAGTYLYCGDDTYGHRYTGKLIIP